MSNTYEHLIGVMRVAGRHELIHYAGAAHRDPVARALCVEYVRDPNADEATLKSRALARVDNDCRVR